ncbi:TPA: hypothetical protein N0F65_004018 [Lagenidium giganteum]|uniref:RING-type domain-containing protein n=1 Tax=Lagenidium giganteum TaxID=4803 RepID=A0AAV2YUU9_9STRA|nr:TPA: hypothetical protein N0F65_004018 [Lagenidium giganteum]
MGFSTAESAGNSESDTAMDMPMLITCQICMDVVPSLDMVTELCGKSCTAQVCLECLVQHLMSTIYSYYPGVLPKVRCPICLKLMNKRQWSQFVQPPPQIEGDDDDAGLWLVDNSHVLEKYDVLCQQSCEFQSPCCHNPHYTMLPLSIEEMGDDEDASSSSPTKLMLAPSLKNEISTLRKKCRAFCYHRMETRVLYDYIMETFGKYATKVFWKILPLISDEERRATLLLHHLHLKPDTYTLCCDEKVCFKCKANVHHDGECDDFDEVECVLQCRGCHVTLVKVDGCDSVTCVCGYQFEWSAEQTRLNLQRQGLAPTSDEEYEQWEDWTQAMWPSLLLIHEHEEVTRLARLEQVVRDYRPAFRKLIHAFRQRQARHTLPSTLEPLQEDAMPAKAATVQHVIDASADDLILKSVAHVHQEPLEDTPVP